MGNVLVVGIGGAGCEMLSTIAEFADSEGTESRYRLVAIDSDRRDLAERAPERATKHRLTADQETVEHVRTELNYLQGIAGLVPETGTKRYRPLGRYLVDSDADAAGLESLLEDEFEACAEESDILQAWIVTSLGGGTGSGATPLVTAVLANCRRRLGVEAELYGLGSLPRLDELAGSVADPTGAPEHYANAYTTLTELRRLMDLDNETSYPLELSLDAAQAGVRAESVEVEENPFDGYWLVGVPEPDGLDQDIFDHANRLVARLIHYVGTTSIPNWLREGYLYSVAGAAVDAQLPEVKRCRHLDREIEKLESELASLRADLNALETAAETVEVALHVDRISLDCVRPNDGESVGPFGAELVADCIRMIDRLVADTPRPERFETVVESFVSNQGDALANEVPENVVVRYLCVLVALERTSEAIDSHRFPACLRRLHSKWLSREHDDAPSPDDGIDEWRREVIGRLRDRRRELEERVDRSMMPAFVSAPGGRLADLNADIDRIERLSDAYGRLERFESFLREERTRTRRRLVEVRAELESRASDCREEWETVRRDLNQISRRRSRLTSALRDPETEGRHVPIRIRNPEAVGRDYHDLRSLVADGIVDDTALQEAFERALPLLEEPVEDLRDGTFDRHGRLGVLVDDADGDVVDRILSNPPEKLGRIHSRWFQFGNDLVSWNRPGDLFLLACYRPIDLKETSEFRTVRERFADSDADVSSLLRGLSDDDVRMRFAYPELVDVVD